LTKKNLLFYLLLPFSLIYGIAVFFRNLLFDLEILKEQKYDIPIISIGNITVGGTGKTPHIEYLVNILQNDFNVAVLSRGYKRKTKGFFLADDLSNAEMIGDEPCQIKKKFPGIVVAVDSNRRNGIKNILTLRKDTGVILLDDAFQHRYVKPGLSMLLIDFSQPVSEDYLLPSGRLRESASGIKRADMIIISKSPEKLEPEKQTAFTKSLVLNKFQKLFFSAISQNNLLPVFKDTFSGNFSKLHNPDLSILLISGIANPKDLKRFAVKISSKITELQFPDHHDFTRKDIFRIKQSFETLDGAEKILITTEKDAMRLQKYSDLPEILKNSMFYIPISVKFLNDEGDIFNNLIISYVKNNK